MRGSQTFSAVDHFQKITGSGRPCCYVLIIFPKVVTCEFPFLYATLDTQRVSRGALEVQLDYFGNHSVKWTLLVVFEIAINCLNFFPNFTQSTFYKTCNAKYFITKLWIIIVSTFGLNNHLLNILHMPACLKSQPKKGHIPFTMK